MADTSKVDVKEVTNTSVEFYKLLTSDDAIVNAKNDDEAYEAFKKHADISREDFQKILDRYSPMVDESSDSEMELTDAELDMVVGGSANWFKNTLNSIKNAVSDTWNSSPTWVKAVVVGVAVGITVAVVVGTGGAALGFGVVAGESFAGSLGAALGIAAGASAAGYIGMSAELEKGRING